MRKIFQEDQSSSRFTNRRLRKSQTQRGHYLGLSNPEWVVEHNTTADSTLRRWGTNRINKHVLYFLGRGKPLTNDKTKICLCWKSNPEDNGLLWCFVDNARGHWDGRFDLDLLCLASQVWGVQHNMVSIWKILRAFLRIATKFLLSTLPCWVARITQLMKQWYLSLLQ